jgi:DNA-directed RNA polymerase specialized sigma24 family protein
VSTAAVATLFRDHHAELVRLALLMVEDLPTAEDVVQDVYASLHRMNRNRSRSRSDVESPLPYVRAAVLNGGRSVQRRRVIARRAAIIHRASLPDEAMALASAADAINTFEVVKANIATGAITSDLGQVPGGWQDEFHLAADRSGRHVLVWMSGNAAKPLHG